jgi:hypothetical protein
MMNPELTIALVRQHQEEIARSMRGRRQAAEAIAARRRLALRLALLLFPPAPQPPSPRPPGPVSVGLTGKSPGEEAS